MAAPNQRIILIQRSSDNTRSNFFKIGNKQLEKAASDLGGNAFKMYIYLADNRNNYKLELSSKDFIAWSNTSKSTYDRAFKELVEKGYLKSSKKNKHAYLFVEESESYDSRHDKIILSDKDLIDELFN